MSDFSNEDKDVFLVKLNRMIDRGALLSRYSRAASLDIREVYRKEFQGNEGKGKDFYRRIFLEYGDESIAELVTAQIAVQNVSNVITKLMEELRVGLSYLEKSSRYVRYDKRVNDHYLYLNPESAGFDGKYADMYRDTCDELFELYSKNYEKSLHFFKLKYPIDSIKFSERNDDAVFIEDLSGKDRESAEKSYNSSIRARALDDLRYLLPASTLTNMGISGNGRAFISLIQKLNSSSLPEAKRVANAIYDELEPELPELIDSAISSHGEDLVKYKAQLDAYCPIEYTNFPKDVHLVELIEHEERNFALRKSLGIIVFANGQEDLVSSIRRIGEMSAEEQINYVKGLADLRRNRRHKLHRAFESVSYLFQITTNYGAFRDMQRHRFVSINRQPLSNRFGFDTPEFFMEAEQNKEYLRVMKMASETYDELDRKYGSGMAQYCIPYAYRYPVSAYMNLREASFFCELRSTPQAHPDLRKIAISIHDEIRRVHPELAILLKFVDNGDYSLGRLKSEHRKEKKLRGLKDGNKQ